jgi:uncharacterized protein
MKVSRKMAIWLGIIVVLVIFVGGGLYVARIARGQALSWVHPPRNHPATNPDQMSLENWEDVTFEATDNLKIAAWFIPAQTESKDGATVILVHGLSANRGEMLNRAAILSRNGYHTLLIDTRDHGDSEGTVTTLGVLEVNDVRGALTFLVTRPEVNAEKIGILGYSSGGAAAIVSAAQLPELRVVISESTYSSVADMAIPVVTALTGRPPFPSIGVVLWFMDQETGAPVSALNPAADAAKLAPRPILVIHGEKDDLIDVSHSQRIFDAAGEPKDRYLVADAGHIDIVEADPAGYERRVVAFLDEYLAG